MHFRCITNGGWILMNDITFYEEEAKTDLICPMDGKILDISGYSVRLGMLRAKWAKYLYEEESMENQGKQELAVIYKERLRFYCYDYEYEIDKKDIPVYIKGDPVYQAAEKVLNEQVQKVKFINEVLGALNSQSFYLNTAMKHILWKSGETV